MEGISYVVDEKGKKTAVLIDLERHGELWNVIYDAYLVESRACEPREAFKSVKARLRRHGKLPLQGDQ